MKASRTTVQISTMVILAAVTFFVGVYVGELKDKIRVSSLQNNILEIQKAWNQSVIYDNSSRLGLDVLLLERISESEAKRLGDVYDLLRERLDEELAIAEEFIKLPEAQASEERLKDKIDRAKRVLNGTL